MKIMSRVTIIMIFFFIISSVNESCRNIIQEDNSLTPQQYTGLGMPDHNKTWTEQDYQKTHIVINNLIIKNFHSLPRINSKKSAGVFRRITSIDNINFLDDPGISLQDKAYKIQSIANMMGQMGTSYTDKSVTRQYYSEELVEIYATHLFIRGKMLELSEKIDKSTNQEDLMMKAGRDGILSSYVLLIKFLVNEYEKTDAFPASDLNKLDKKISFSISENIKYLDPGSKQRLLSVINNSIKNSPSGLKANNYKNILTMLDQ